MTVPTEAQLREAAASVMEANDLDGVFGDWFQTFPDICDEEQEMSQKIATKVKDDVVALIRSPKRRKPGDVEAVRQTIKLIQSFSMPKMTPLVAALEQIILVLKGKS